LLSGPLEAIRSLLEASVRSEIWANAVTSLYEIGVAFLLAASVGLGIGLAIGISKYLSSVFEPLVLALFAVPKISLLPLFVLWFKIGSPTIIFFGFFSGLFPIMVNTIAGAKQVNISHVQLAKSMGANQWQIYRKIVLPSIVPSAFAGLRLSLILVSVTVTLAEMFLGASIGLGGLIYFWTSTFNTAPLYAVILVFSLVLIVANQALLILEKRLNSFRA